MELELLRTRRAKEELEMAADDEQLCCVCMDRPKMVMFEPCCHVSVCKQCAPRMYASPSGSARKRTPRERWSCTSVRSERGCLPCPAFLGSSSVASARRRGPTRNPQPAVKS